MSDAIVECSCGCGATWADEGDGRRYATASCRQRAKRQRDAGELPVPMPDYVKRIRDQLAARRPRRRV